jgi:hypothetical protein
MIRRFATRNRVMVDLLSTFKVFPGITHHCKPGTNRGFSGTIPSPFKNILSFDIIEFEVLIVVSTVQRQRKE